MNKKSLKVICPKCKKEFNYYDSEYRPFCGKRCKMVDLGLWLSGSYSVPGEEIKDDESEALDEEHDEFEEE